MNPDLIRWTEDGKTFSYDCKNIAKVSQWLTEFGTYSMGLTAVAVPSRRVDSHIPLSLAIPIGLPSGESFRRRLNVYGFCIR
jgi:hypothetical protein